MTKSFLPLAAFVGGCVALGSVSLAEPRWNSIHLDNTHNAVRASEAVITDLSALPPIEVPGQGITSGVRLIEYFGNVLAVRYEGEDVRVLRYPLGVLPGTVEPAYVSPAMPAGVSGSFSSLAAPSVNESRMEYYFAAGEAVHIIRPLSSSDELTSIELTDENTNEGQSLTIVNSSVALSADGNTGFVKTFLGFGDPRQSQLVAVDLVEGEVAWSVVTAGPGQVTPLVIDVDGVGEIVVVDASDSEGRGGLAAFRASDGEPVWNHATVANPWHTGGTQFYADFVYNNGRIYGVTYDFSANGQLAIVDAATGAATLSPAPGSDIAPVVLDGDVFIVGGGFGDAHIARFNGNTGAQVYNQPLAGGGKYVFRNYLAANSNGIYVPTSNGFGADDNPALHLVNPATGNVVSSTPADAAFSGTVSVLSDGSIATIGGGGTLRLFSARNVVQPFNYVYLANEEQDRLDFTALSQTQQGVSVPGFMGEDPRVGSRLQFIPVVSSLRSGNIVGVGIVFEYFEDNPSASGERIVPLRGRLRQSTRVEAVNLPQGTSPVAVRQYRYTINHALRIAGGAQSPVGGWNVNLVANAATTNQSIGSDIQWGNLVAPTNAFQLALATPDSRARTRGTTTYGAQNLHSIRAEAGTLAANNFAGTSYDVLTQSGPTYTVAPTLGEYVGRINVALQSAVRNVPGRFNFTSEVLDGSVRANGLVETNRDAVTANPDALLSALQPRFQYVSRVGQNMFSYSER